MSDAVLYIPIVTTVFSALFAWTIYQRHRKRPGSPHLAWWAAGLVIYGAGTFAEGFTALFGWRESIFREWYITGALMGGAPLAQGTVYLLLPRQTANRLTIALVSFIAVAALFVLLTPLEAVPPETKRLETAIIEWTWVRAFSPLVNTYAFLFLVGGAVSSAVRYRRTDVQRARGTALIALGAILPGIGGSFTRAGYTEVLYVTELVGLLFIYSGYRLTVRTPLEARLGVHPEVGEADRLPA